MLNERATRDVLSGAGFKLQLGQGTLLDVLLNELISIKQ